MSGRKNIKKTLGDLFLILDDKTTIGDILYGYNFWLKEKERSKIKNQKRSKKIEKPGSMV